MFFLFSLKKEQNLVYLFTTKKLVVWIFLKKNGFFLTLIRIGIIEVSFSSTNYFTRNNEKKLHVIDDQQSQHIYKYYLIEEVIAIDLQPSSVVSDLGFQRFKAD